ncbi:FUSC family protein [archaeon]|nr:MAG: FUSC family protein [archaeon]
MLIKDVTFGATLINFWSCILASCFATILAHIAYVILDSLYSDPTSYPVPLVVLFLFICVFIMQYSEIHILGKKLGVSLLALNLLSYQAHKRHSKIMIWQFLMSVFIGSICALIGTVIPPPFRLARREVYSRLQYYGKMLPAVLHQQVTAWLLESNKGVILSRLWASQQAQDVVFSPAPSCIASVLHRTHHIPLTSRWRKVRILLRALSAFKHSIKYHIGWLDTQSFHIKSVYMRRELNQYLSDQVAELERTVAEAKYEIHVHTNSTHPTACFKACIHLVSRFLIVIKEFERQLGCMGNQPNCFYIYSAFFSCPDFRRGLFNLVGQINSTLSFLLGDFQIGRHTVIYEEVGEQIKKIHIASEEFDAIYLTMRKRLYYGIHAGNSSDQPSSASNMFAQPALLPIEAEVTFTMNTSLFLLDSLCDLIAMCYVDLAQAIQTVSISLPMRLLMCFRSVYLDFIPCHRSVCRKCTRPTALKTRLQATLLVSFTMLLAGLYGVYAQRSQPSLASFTIAYLAGGSTSGVNIMTCINRAVGTVLACVYVIIIAYIVTYIHTTATNGSISSAAFSLEALVLGVSSVVFQLPCTYVRTYPLYSYSGTVAGFTAALLLINPNLTVSQAVDRIVDTFVGVVIYIVVELLFFAQGSERMLLKDMSCFLKGINKQFSKFIRHVTLLDTEEFSDMSDELEKLHAVLRRQRDLLPFYKSEPSLFSAPPLPDRLLLDMLREEEEVLVSLTLMQRVVGKIKSLASASNLFERLDETNGIQFGSQRSNPSSDIDQGSEDDIDVDTAETDDMVMTSHQPAHSPTPPPYGSIYSRPSMGTYDSEYILPHFQPILLPLRPQFKKLEDLVEGALAYLDGCLIMLQRDNIQSIWRNYKQECSSGSAIA